MSAVNSAVHQRSGRVIARVGPPMGPTKALQRKLAGRRAHLHLHLLLPLACQLLLPLARCSGPRQRMRSVWNEIEQTSRKRNGQTGDRTVTGRHGKMNDHGLQGCLPMATIGTRLAPGALTMSLISNRKSINMMHSSLMHQSPTSEMEVATSVTLDDRLRD